MSAIHPIATAIATGRNSALGMNPRRCPLCAQLRTTRIVRKITLRAYRDQSAPQQFSGGQARILIGDVRRPFGPRADRGTGRPALLLILDGGLTLAEPARWRIFGCHGRTLTGLTTLLHNSRCRHLLGTRGRGRHGDYHDACTLNGIGTDLSLPLPRPLVNPRRGPAWLRILLRLILIALRPAFAVTPAFKSAS